MELKDGEIWKPIPGYPFYEASSFGRIRSVDKAVKHNYGGIAIKKGKILSIGLNQKGYVRTGLTINGKVKEGRVHILVALAWHPNPEKKKTVNHIDTNKQNNRADNLEWATQKEQVDHAIKNNCRKNWGLSQKTIGKIVAKTKKRIIVTDTLENKTVTISSVNNTAKLLQVGQSGISVALKRGSLIRKRYKVEYAGLAIDSTTLNNQKQTT